MGSMVFASSEMLVSGLPLMMLLTSHNTVSRKSSFTVCSFMSELRILLLCGFAFRKFRLDGNSWAVEFPFYSLWFQFCDCPTVWWIPFFSAASLDGDLTSPTYKATNCVDAGVRIKAATSMCTARRVRQVNITPYLLMVLWPRLTSNGPKKSTPVLVKGGWSGMRRSSGRLAIFCSPTFPDILRNTVHLLMIFLIAELACGIHIHICISVAPTHICIHNGLFFDVDLPR